MSVSVCEAQSTAAKPDALPADAQAVAQHYNAVPQVGIVERTKSRIFYLRNFNNWIKSMMINDVMQTIRLEKRSGDVTVLDLCCGKGGDLLKWRKANIRRLVCADIADVSLEQARQRYDDLCSSNRGPRLFSAEFINADCAQVRLRDRYQDAGVSFDLTSCQFSLHYAFESLQKARCMLRNACENLVPGGFFIGTIPDANRLVSLARRYNSASFGNDVYRVCFDSDPVSSTPPLFGARYSFTLDQSVNDCPEYLVHFPLLQELLECEDMTLLHRWSFAETFDRFAETADGNNLLHRMQALEPYPSVEGAEAASSNAEDYASVQGKVDAVKGTANDRVGTLSAADWEVACIYQVFVFRKRGTLAPPPVRRGAHDVEGGSDAKRSRSESNQSNTTGGET